jgi:3-dehydroquinate synthase
MAKNLIGAFYQPSLVYIDTKLLNTLPLEDFRSGIAEIIKTGVIMDADFFAYLEKNIEALLQREPDILRYVVERSCRYKIEVVKKDPLEKSGLRKILNYGHTVGHALEAVSEFKLRHGEGVSIGMVAAMQLAIDLGFADASCAERQANLLRRAGLPTEFPDGVNIDELINRIRLDKKGAFRFVLPSKIGEIKCDYAEDGKVIYDHKLSIEQIWRTLQNV